MERLRFITLSNCVKKCRGKCMTIEYKSIDSKLFIEMNDAAKKQKLPYTFENPCITSLPISRFLCALLYPLTGPRYKVQFGIENINNVNYHTVLYIYLFPSAEEHKTLRSYDEVDIKKKLDKFTINHNLLIKNEH